MTKTYRNKNGTPIIRKCGNCVNYKPIEDNKSVGYCNAMKLFFAFTHDQSVYAMVKDFYLCEQHKLPNEDILMSESEEVDLLPYLLDRNARKKLQ